MMVLVCGGRDYFKPLEVNSAMDAFNQQNPITMVVHGDAKGADRLAGRWAASNGVHPCAIPALWDFYHLQAGGTRNSAMLNLPIQYCIAFPGGTGTNDMIKKCKEKGISVWQPYG